MKHLGTTASGQDIATQSQLGGGASLLKGSATLDFGLAGSDVATVTVAAPSVTAGSVIVVALNPAGTAFNDADEHFAEPANPKVSAISPGVSFNISMASTDQTDLFGTWSVNWVIT